MSSEKPSTQGNTDPPQRSHGVTAVAVEILLKLPILHLLGGKDSLETEARTHPEIFMYFPEIKSQTIGFGPFLSLRNPSFSDMLPQN